MVTKKGFTQFVDFRTPGEVIFVPTCGRIRHKVRMHFSFKIFLYTYSQHGNLTSPTDLIRTLVKPRDRVCCALIFVYFFVSLFLGLIWITRLILLCYLCLFIRRT